MIVPLAARGRVLGSMTLLSTRGGRHYAESDLAFAMALAERCALAIDNARLHDRAERSLSLLDTVFSTAPWAWPSSTATCASCASTTPSPP